VCRAVSEKRNFSLEEPLCNAVPNVGACGKGLGGGVFISQMQTRLVEHRLAAWRGRAKP
jgi:hypothetical protein